MLIAIYRFEAESFRHDLKSVFFIVKIIYLNEMKQKIKKGIKYVVLLIVVAVVGLLCFVSFVLSDVGDPESLTIELTAQKIERGKYLTNSVNVCMDCHSKRDWTKLGEPMVEGTFGQGGAEFNQKFGFPGRFFSRTSPLML